MADKYILDHPISFTKNNINCWFYPYSLEWIFLRTYRKPPKPKKFIVKIPKTRFKVLQVLVTGNCNYGCKYCSIMDGLVPLPPINIDTKALSKACQKAKMLPPDGMLLITGGEPLLNIYATSRLIQSFSGRKILFTNGSLLTREIASLLHKNNVLILLSVDGGASVHNRSRIKKTSEGTFLHAASAMKMLNENNIPFGISMVLNRHNKNNILDEIKYLHTTFSPSSFGVNLLHYTKRKDYNKISKQHISDLYGKLYELSLSEGIYIDQIARRLTPLISKKFLYRDCSAASGKIVIFPDGKLNNCVHRISYCASRPNWEELFPLNEPSCKECPGIGICGGGCLYDGDRIIGIGKFDLRHCMIVKKILDKAIWSIYDKFGMISSEDNRCNKLLLKYFSGMIRAGNKNQYARSIGHET